MWERVGPYDERYTFYGEDSEWGRRLMSAGARIVLDPGLEIPHTKPVASSEVRCQRSFLAQAVNTQVESRHGDSSTLDRSSRPKDRLWSGVVGLGAHGNDAECYRLRGKRIDALLPFLPKSLARRLVSWGVESAGIAGRRSVGAGNFSLGIAMGAQRPVRGEARPPSER